MYKKRDKTGRETIEATRIARTHADRIRRSAKTLSPQDRRQQDENSFAVTEQLAQLVERLPPDYLNELPKGEQLAARMAYYETKEPAAAILAHLDEVNGKKLKVLPPRLSIMAAITTLEYEETMELREALAEIAAKSPYPDVKTAAAKMLWSVGS